MSAVRTGRNDVVRPSGKYRATVVDNADPLSEGRIKVRVPEIGGGDEWALPCVPYAGPMVGMHMVPPVGADVWVEFEGGDASRPIWTGCFWGNDILPTDDRGERAAPDVKILRSEQGLLLALHDDTGTIALSDGRGANLLEIRVQHGAIALKASAKVVIDAPAIELGANAAHPGVFGVDLIAYLNQLVAIFNTHMHPGETVGPTPVTPAPPAPPLTPPIPTMLSMKVRLG